MSDAGKPEPIDFSALYNKVRENRDRLDACPRHFFPDLIVKPRHLGQKAKCSVCGGEMDLIAINYYVRGFEAAGKSGNDIVPGWKEPGTDETPKRTFFAPDE